MTKFKVGDKVKEIRYPDYMGNITEILDDSYHWTIGVLLDKPIGKNHIAYFREDELEKCSDE